MQNHNTRRLLSNYFFLDGNNYFHPSQHRFRIAFSCETQLTIFFMTCVLTWSSMCESVQSILDLEKAFDKVPNYRLQLKVQLLNLDPNVLMWIREFLYIRTQMVSVNNNLSSPLPVTSGMLQVSALGFLLFSYILMIHFNVSPLIYAYLRTTVSPHYL